MSLFRPLSGIIFSVAIAASSNAQAMRCQSKIISSGDAALTLEQKCGPPDFVTTRTIAKTTSVIGSEDAGATTRVFEKVETWIYRGKAGEMARFVEVRRGKVGSIRLVHVSAVDDPVRCQRVLQAGESTLGKVRLACGSPADVSQWSEERTITRNGLEQSELITHERWVYDLGPGRFLRILNFEGDLLVSIQTGRRQSE